MDRLGVFDITIRAKVHTIGGYSAHADQNDPLGLIPQASKEIRVIHGECTAREALRTEIETWARFNGCANEVTLAA